LEVFRNANGVILFLKALQKFNELSPFSYEVDSKGGLIDKSKLELWKKF